MFEDCGADNSASNACFNSASSALLNMMQECCTIKDSTAGHLVTCLKNYLPRLKHLSIGSIGNGDWDDETDYCVLSELRRLHLRSLYFGVRCGPRRLSMPQALLPQALSPLACEMLGGLCSLERLHFKCKKGIHSFAPFARLTNLRALTLDGCWDMRMSTGLNAFLAACPNITELAIPCIEWDWPPRSSSIRRMTISGMSCDFADLPTRTTLPALTHLSVSGIRHVLQPSEVELAGTLQALTGVHFECGGAVLLLSSDAVSSCAGLVHVLSSEAFVILGAGALKCHDIHFAPQLLSSLAPYFPHVRKLCLKECKVIPSELCDFPNLTTCTIQPSEDDLEDGEGFEHFRHGILELCFAVQARRPATLPKLRLIILDGMDGLQPDGLLELLKTWERLAESGEVSKVCLSCKSGLWWSEEST